tara:strand:+ start:15356 stop:15580 length:225 start_codon:yes stop_codon:yes gene_type:complete
MKAIDMNPILEDYVHHETGKKISLNEYVKDEAEALSHEYIRLYKKRPSNAQIINWMKRLKQAYHKGIVTGTRIE